MIVGETMNQSGAERLMLTIRAFWIGRGYRPNVRIEQMRINSSLIKESDYRNIYVVRSDMINGYPREMG